ncbi:hypothetical protein, partial [Streptomyces rochei]|uniref:hypothetical protein n=1 Tax=Streptomyces rochei TaxID=1928 RepID=UPI0033EEB5DC
SHLASQRVALSSYAYLERIAIEEYIGGGAGRARERERGVGGSPARAGGRRGREGGAGGAGGSAENALRRPASLPYTHHDIEIE